MTSRDINIAWSVIVLAAGTGASVVSAQERVGFRVRMPAAVRAHEPVQITFSIESPTGEETSASLGWNRIGVFTFYVTRPDGTKLVARPTAPPLGGISAGSSVVVGVGSPYSGWILLNEWVDLSMPGKYSITMTSDAKFKDVTSGMARAADTAWTTTLVVTAPSDTEIRALCERLSQQALDSVRVPSEAGRKAAVSLANVRHRVVVPYLEAVARHGRWAWIAIPALGRLSEPAARNALEALARGDGEVGELATGELKRRSVIAK